MVCRKAGAAAQGSSALYEKEPSRLTARFLASLPPHVCRLKEEAVIRPHFVPVSFSSQSSASFAGIFPVSRA